MDVRRSFRDRFGLLLGALLSALAVLPATGCGGTGPASRPVAVGSSAPVVHASDLGGAAVDLGGTRGGIHGGPVLLSFVSSDPGTLPSRATAVVDASMALQYRSAGLQVVLADLSATRWPQDQADDRLTNLGYDWHLGAVRIVRAQDLGALAAAYDAGSAPATFLIGADGTVLKHWDGTLLAQSVALALPAAGVRATVGDVSATTPAQQP